jgi:phage regulator Rha-like protein
MSSFEIAKLTNKRHDNVLRDIKAILEEAGIDALKFEGVYKGGNGEDRPCFNLPRLECDLVVSGYSVKYRLAIIKRWHELEAAKPKLPKPSSRRELIKLILEQEDELERQEKEITKLTIVIDNEFGYCSILRTARFLGVSEKLFTWQKLKRESEIVLGIPVKRVPSPRYGYQNLYPIQAFMNVYPEYDFYGLVPDNIDDVQRLAFGNTLPYNY